MKRKWIRFLLILLPLLSFSRIYAQSYQLKVKQAFHQDLLLGRGELNVLHAKLEEEISQKGNDIHKLIYWLAYNEYYMAKFYEIKKQEKLASSIIKRGIKHIEGLSVKTVEDYILLGHLQREYIKYAGFKRISFARQTAKNCEIAMGIDPTNPRVYLLAGLNDLGRPRIFGGGKLGEQYLLKALNECSYKTDNNTIEPSWGKEEAYEAIIRHYIKAERYDDARSMFYRFIEAYPNNYSIKELSVLLEISL